jgi:hypothetical protein
MARLRSCKWLLCLVAALVLFAAFATAQSDAPVAIAPASSVVLPACTPH